MSHLIVPDMSCGHCVKTITEAITALDASATVSTDVQNKTVSIQSQLTDADIRHALTEAGYPPAP